MKCPFLRECQVEFCQAAPVRKIIEQTSGSSIGLCASPAFYGCAAYKRQEKAPTSPYCPYLQESQAQFCALDPEVRLIVCPEEAPSRCDSANHAFCQTYLAARPRKRPVEEPARSIVDGMPGELFYTRNHMWLDINADRDCHIGFDALLASALGDVEKISFVMREGEGCPSVIVTAHEAHVHLVFPHPMRILGFNAQVRAKPRMLRRDPYGSGWLFEGKELERREIRGGLLTGEQARRWMEGEVRRVGELLRSRMVQEREMSSAMACDGGLPIDRAIRFLSRVEIPRFFEELFNTEEVV